MSASTATTFSITSRLATGVRSSAAARSAQIATVGSSIRGTPLKLCSSNPSLPLRKSRVPKAVQTDPSTDEATEKAQKVLGDLKAKWDKVDDKPSVLLYGGGALVALWFSSAIVGAFNSVPLLPKLLELIGLGYSGWFVYRYLLFTPNRQELLDKIDEFSSQITGESKELSKDIESASKPVVDKVDSVVKDVKEEYKSVTK